MNLHKACSQPASATRSSDILERVRGQMFNNIAQLHELREVNANYSEQLHSASMVIDKLRERRDYFAKCTAALKGVCIANHIADCKLLEAYDRLGVLEKVLEERERKRKRDDNGVPIEVIAISPISDEHEGEEGYEEDEDEEDEDEEDEDEEEDEEDEYELASA